MCISVIDIYRYYQNMDKAQFLTISLQFVYGFIYAVDGGLNLYPRDPVRKVGEAITFECFSDYTGLQFGSVKFSLKHGDVEIFKMAVADSTVGDNSVKRFSKPILSQSDAGVYTCIVTPSDDAKTVSAETKLYVVEVEDTTAVAVKGKTANMSCLRSDQEDLPLVIFWMAAGMLIDDTSSMYSQGLNLHITNTATTYAFETFTCLVISETALTVYQNITDAKNSGAVTEVDRKLSVVEFVMDQCKILRSCVLEVYVYDNSTPNITWMFAGEVLDSVTEISANLTASKTPVLNITSTQQVEVYINGFRFDNWNNRATPVHPDKPQDSNVSLPAGAITGIVLGILAFIGIGVVLMYVKTKHSRDAAKEKADALEKEHLKLVSPCPR